MLEHLRHQLACQVDLGQQAIGGGLAYEFSESTGLLQVVQIPEPSTGLLLGGMGALALIRRRGRTAA